MYFTHCWAGNREFANFLPKVNLRGDFCVSSEV